MQAERRGVDRERRSGGMGHADAYAHQGVGRSQFLSKTLGTLRVAVNQDEVFHASGYQCKRNGGTSAAHPHDEGRPVGMQHTVVTGCARKTNAVKTLARPGAVCLQAQSVDQPGTPRLGPGHAAQGVSAGFVRHGDVQALQVADFGQLHQSCGQVVRMHAHRHLAPVKPFGFERRVVHAGGSHMLNRETQHRHKTGCARQR